jgi:hypothetical protein
MFGHGLQRCYKKPKPEEAREAAIQFSSAKDGSWMEWSMSLWLGPSMTTSLFRVSMKRQPKQISLPSACFVFGLSALQWMTCSSSPSGTCQEGRGGEVASLFPRRENPSQAFLGV